MIIRKNIIAASLATACATGAFVPLHAEESQTIVVTAQSRQQTVQDVPITMQVVTMKDVDAIGASNLTDMNGYIPGLVVGGGDETQPSFGLRGINPSDFGVATDAPVGVYVDGAYAAKSGGALMNFLDVQRIEVLKGPQGTLFGRNSAAGALSIVTNEPEAEFDATGAVRLGSWNSTRINGMVNAPVNDKLSVRFAVIADKSDNWKENVYVGNSKDGGSDSVSGRFSAKWSPDAQTKLVGSYEHSYVDQKARPAYGVAPFNDVNPFTGAAIPSVPAAFSTFFDPRDANLMNDAPSKEKLNFNSANIRFETPLAGMTFNSLSSWREFKTKNLGDYDGTSQMSAYLSTLNKENTTIWQQEFKLSSKNEKYDWVSGLSFYRSDAKQTSGATLSTDSLDTLDYRINALAPIHGGAASGFFFTGGVLDMFACGAAGVCGNPSTLWSEQMDNKVTSKSMAVYGDVIWHLTSTTNLTTGARWTRDKKSVSWYVPPATTSDANLTADAMTGLLGGAAPTNLIFSDAAIAASTKVKANDSWSNLSPRLVVDHKYDADTMVFASYSQGYQSGGYSVVQPLAEFAPEKMKNGEVGIKMNFPTQKAVMNASLFKYKFSDLQSIELVNNVGNIPVYDVTSGDQKAWGLDIDGGIRVNSNLRLFTAAEYIVQKWENKIDKYGVDVSGQLTGLPKLTSMAGMVVNWSGLGGFMEWNFQGTYTSKNSNCPNIPQPDEYTCEQGAFKTGQAQSKFDTRVSWMNSDRRYGVSVVVNNIFDKQYVSVPGGTASTIGAFYSDISHPRFVGVEVKAAL